MKFNLTEIPQRILVRPNPQDEIQNYGDGNVYPQITDNAIKGSGRATQCSNIFGKFVRGGGMAIPFYKTVVNRLGLTVDKLHRKIVDDYKKHKGFAIHCNFNMLGETISLSHVPFKECRLGLEDESGQVRTIKHHPDWGRETSKNFMRDKLISFNVYNPDPVVINAEAEEAGGFAKYKGQIFYYGADGTLNYPESSIDPVLEDTVSDYEGKQFRLNNITTNFMASHIFRHPPFETEPERRSYLANLKKFQGGKNGSKIFDLEESDPNNSFFKVDKVDIQDMDGLFKETEDSVRESIRSNYMLPGILASDLIAGKLGTAQEMKDAYDFYNSITADDRMIFEEVFTELFAHWYQPNINPDNNYQTIPLKFMGTIPTTTTNANPPANN